AVVELGGGRRRPDERIDHSVGFSGLAPIGAQVARGDTLALVHARTREEAERAAMAVLGSYKTGPAKPSLKKPVVRRIAAR
ncbi:MAG TPA: thymidine phosphorylase, partial [Mesorhizobium sp.]